RSPARRAPWCWVRRRSARGSAPVRTRDRWRCTGDGEPTWRRRSTSCGTASPARARRNRCVRPGSPRGLPERAPRVHRRKTGVSRSPRLPQTGAVSSDDRHVECSRMRTTDDTWLAQRIRERTEGRLDETSGLVVSPLQTPMLQPWEVYDQDLFELEMIRVFARAWVWLGDTEDLKEPGDFLTGRVGHQGVIVIRQTDGTVRGFLTNCRHRASGLASEPAGHCGKTLTCPYHNWAYAIDGRLIGIPDEKRMYPDGFPKDDYGLVPIRIEVAWDKLVFGCLSRKAPPFRDWIAPLAERYDRYGFERFTRFYRQ